MLPTSCTGTTDALRLRRARCPPRPATCGSRRRGIAPVPEANRYGGPGRLFTVWFAPNLTMTGVFTGTVGIALGLDFRTALAAVVFGTVVGAVPTAVSRHLGQPHRDGQLPLARLAFGRAVVLPGAAAVAVLGRLGRADRAVRRGRAGPAVRLAVLGRRARDDAARRARSASSATRRSTGSRCVMTFVLAAAFAVLAVKLLDGVHPAATGSAHGADRAGAFVLTSTDRAEPVAVLGPVRQRLQPLPAARHIPPADVLVHAARSSPRPSSPCRRSACGARPCSPTRPRAGVDELLGGGRARRLRAARRGARGGVQQRDERLQRFAGPPDDRGADPAAARRGLAAALGFPLVLWMHAADTAARFQNVLLFVGYWIPGFVAVVGVDWVGAAPGPAAARRSTCRRESARPSAVVAAGCSPSSPPSPPRCRSWTPACTWARSQPPCTAPTSRTTWRSSSPSSSTRRCGCAAAGSRACRRRPSFARRAAEGRDTPSPDRADPGGPDLRLARSSARGAGPDVLRGTPS